MGLVSHDHSPCHLFIYLYAGCIAAQPLTDDLRRLNLRPTSKVLPIAA